MKHVKKQKGFTIIELVVVILLLGILTATALPRFMDVTDDAHNSVVNAVSGGIVTGASLFKAEWYATAQPTRVSSWANMLATTNGYPLGIDATTATSTLLSSVGSSANCQEIFETVLQPAGRPTITSKITAATTLGGLATLPSSFDFVAYLSSASASSKDVCNYIYTGQYNNVTLYALPVLRYDSTTGVITQSSI